MFKLELPKNICCVLFEIQLWCDYIKLLNKCCVSTDAEWRRCLCVVIARMLNAGCTDAGHNSTFGLMPTVYISYKTVTTIWAIKYKLPASLTRENFSPWAVYWLIKLKLPVKSYCKSFHKKLSSNNILLKAIEQKAPATNGIRKLLYFQFGVVLLKVKKIYFSW